MRPAGRRQRGATAPIVAGAALVLALFAVGGATLGRLAAAHMDLQRAADATALGTADLMREQGRQANQTSALALGQRNVRWAVTLSTDVTETTTAVVTRSAGSANVAAPRLVFTSGTATVHARATGQVAQVTLSSVTMPHAKVVLVLDYSGSMSTPLGGGSTRLQTLKDSIHRLLGEPMRIDYAAVIFSDDVVGCAGAANNDCWVPFEPDALDKILQMVDANNVKGGTATEKGLAKARDLLSAPDLVGQSNKFVLLVSDGLPNRVPQATAAARPIWDLPATIITLHIDDEGDVQARDYMVSVSGPHGGDASWYYPVRNAADLESRFQEILARIGCPLPPLTGVETPPLLGAFLRTGPGASERKLVQVPPGGDLAAYRNQEAFRFDPAGSVIVLTIPACTAVAERHEQLVVRYNRGRLVE
ncbi:MAG TPA: vWA domain-containing protein [Polyangia bacterium]|nr:vWA domain-containing protein [Polyangia bacterium]